MAAFTTMAIAAAAVAGAGATVYAVGQQKKAAKAQARALEEQQAKAETITKESAALYSPRDKTGADIQLGRQTGTTTAVQGDTTPGATTTRPGGVKGRVGGVGKPTDTFSSFIKGRLRNGRIGL